MSSLTPSPLAPPPEPSKPSASTVKEVATPWLRSGTTWAIVVQVVTLAPLVIDYVTHNPAFQIPPSVQPWLLLVGFVANQIGQWRARQGGVDAAARSTEINRAEMVSAVDAVARMVR